MLNEIHLEGAVTHTWVFRDVQFARIACRTDPGRQQVSEGDGRPSEYITLRFEPPTLARAASTLGKGQVVRASGYLASREYDISLASFADSAKGEGKALASVRDLAEEMGERVHKPHVLNEVVVERFSVEGGDRRRRSSRPTQKKRQEEQEKPVPEPTS
jgi:hypothetical protein